MRCGRGRHMPRPPNPPMRHRLLESLRIPRTGSARRTPQRGGIAPKPPRSWATSASRSMRATVHAQCSSRHTSPGRPRAATQRAVGRRIGAGGHRPKNRKSTAHTASLQSFNLSHTRPPCCCGKGSTVSPFSQHPYHRSPPLLQASRPTQRRCSQGMHKGLPLHVHCRVNNPYLSTRRTLAETPGCSAIALDKGVSEGGAHGWLG